MSGSLSRRVAAVEAQRRRAGPSQHVYRFEPSGVTPAEMAAWYETEVAPAEAAGLDVTIYRWSDAVAGACS